jgi:hypothetical protein
MASRPRLFALLTLGWLTTLPACDLLGRGEGSGEDDGVERRGSEKKTAPPKGKWQDKSVGSKLEFPERKENVEVSVRGDRGKIGLHVTLNKFPKGSTAKIGDDSTTVDHDYASLEVMLPFELGGVSIADGRDHNKKIDLGAKLVLEWPTTEPLETDVPPQKIWSGVAKALASIDKSPVKFVGEPESEGVDTVVALDINGYIREVLGSGEKLQDIDLLATESRSETARTKKCTGYEKGDIELTMMDSVVKLYERRSGKLVEEKTFAGQDRCPSVAFVSSDGKGKSYADTKEMDSWLKSFIK